MYDFVEHESLYLLVMERLGGGTLATHARGIDPQSAVAATVAMCAALQYAHERDVLHRDVKPGNALITEDGLLKMTDFGIAKMLSGTRTYSTEAGLVLGTPAYMAPEQVDGSVPGRFTDVYGAGTVLYELLSRRLPYEQDGDPLTRLSARARGPDPAPPRAERHPRWPTSDALAGARPGDRHQSAEDLGVAIANAAAGAWGPDGCATTASW